MLGRLRNESIVPSSTWAYTAGASYKDPPALGSLTFGGYDAKRLNDSAGLEVSGISVPLGKDISRDLVVGLQSITHDTLGSSPLMANGIYAFIDSMVTHM